MVNKANGKLFKQQQKQRQIESLSQYFGTDLDSIMVKFQLLANSVYLQQWDSLSNKTKKINGRNDMFK
ncbi:MAG: hypothetical protein WA421_10410 [Nitrososphaeraceae archaeon]